MERAEVMEKSQRLSLEDIKITDWENGTIEYYVYGEGTYVCEHAFTYRGITPELIEVIVFNPDGLPIKTFDIVESRFESAEMVENVMAMLIAVYVDCYW